jgi:hypothetical protein
MTVKRKNAPRKDRKHEWRESRVVAQAWKRLWRYTDKHVTLNPAERETLRERWYEEAQHYDRIWRRERWRYYGLGVTAITAGVATSLLVGVGAPVWTPAITGAVVALSGSIQGFFHLGERWPHQRLTAVLLKAEGLRFVERRPPYAQYRTHHQAFPHFIDELEQINEAQTETYLRLQTSEHKAPK